MYGHMRVKKVIRSSQQGFKKEKLFRYLEVMKLSAKRMLAI